MAHPTAMQIGNQHGLDTKEVEGVLYDVAKHNSGLLVGGYNVDIMIIAIYVVLIYETDEEGNQQLDYDSRIYRIGQCIAEAYAGLI